MAKEGGFIALHRKILDWEWFGDPITFRTFVYLLLSANFEPATFQGVEIQRGQLVTSLPKISKELQQTIQQTRTALKHLKSTGEITDKITNKYRVITIVKYDQYQQANRQTNRKLTGNQQANQQTNQHQYNNINNNKNNNNNSLTRVVVPPTVQDVKDYCDQRMSWWIDAEKFVDYYAARGWMLSNGKKMVDWRAAVRLWERREKERDEEKRKTPEEIPY